jgi:hypothetical protein
MAPITVAVWRPSGYKYLLHSPSRTISHFFHSSLPCLGFPSPVLSFSTIEGKRGIKRERSPCAEGSPTASDTMTAPSVPSRTPSPPGFAAEVCSHCPRSPVLEQGGLSEMAPVVDLSSPQGEENPLHDIARDFKFAQRLFGKLNRAFLGPPGDGKVIILSDSDEEEEEAREENSTGAKDAATSAIINLVSTASTDDISTPAEKSSTPAASPADVDNDFGVGPDDSSDSLAPGPKVEEGSGGGDEAGAP